MVGGDWTWTSPDTSTLVSVWTSQDVQCALPSLRQGMAISPSVDYVLGKILACYFESCDQLTPSGWSYFSSTVQFR